MDKKLTVETVAMILLIVAFPVISIGTTGDLPVVWWIGFAVFAIGSALPVWTRFMDHSTDRVRDAGIEFDERVS